MPDPHHTSRQRPEERRTACQKISQKVTHEPERHPLQDRSSSAFGQCGGTRDQTDHAKRVRIWARRARITPRIHRDMVDVQPH
jgi:hypothetical protein